MERLPRNVILDPSFLQLLGTTVVPQVAGDFVARERFLEGEDSRFVLDDNFKAWFLGKVEPAIQAGSASEKSLISCLLLKGTFDPNLIKEIGEEERAKTFLSVIWTLLERQNVDEDGALLTTREYANIFFAYDVREVLRSVGVSHGFKGWHINAFPTTHVKAWAQGNRVFFEER
ncbi:MAG: hypothetical protein UT86_C0005G0042 [Candidatus Magasanikbacteria bacterium GW2011_GWC2_40_17]|uniref:Uncharacterized protein n=1 Tax=Candidatus Magasanikbacteria bacterium GW2011_GWA2_42_32 TaxID=1619039 RepID=A0A0G1D438_9BACT|nr:MAG: hypothetical protein UT86_C0005G0042 [Candidatus Magasanikbacteria bacterium GW2011_GWC2_40_17]KKS56778.1 MAG: hypothetical protein UV20_C0006G0061 [Candidatus Magasanikbacteria bacterium GW2011_GWA2_42_32]OGH86034.1 MAG: hypothetical protein A2294_02090 [Candidatus Magasanikbacteria bacterium RIFOXYB2_FULL_38_10]